MKVYVVTTGEYSDYGVHSIYDDEQTAKDLVDVLNKGKYSYGTGRYMEIEVNSSFKERVGFEVIVDVYTGNQVIDQYHKEVQTCVLTDGPETRFDGKFDPTDECFVCRKNDEEKKWETSYPLQRKEEFKDYKIKSNWYVARIYSKSETVEKALKSARDKRAEVLAILEGIV